MSMCRVCAHLSLPYLSRCASLPVPSPCLKYIIPPDLEAAPRADALMVSASVCTDLISAPWILIPKAGGNTAPQWRDLLEAGGGSHHQIISIIIIQRGGISSKTKRLEAEEEKKKRWVRQIYGAQEAQTTRLLYFHRKWRRGFCSCYRSTPGKICRFQRCFVPEGWGRGWRCGTRETTQILNTGLGYGVII